MKRAIQTTIHMFKNHPEKHNIHFIVLPYVMEAVGYACDVPIDFWDLYEKYGGKSHYTYAENTYGIKFDFHYITDLDCPDLW